MRILYLIGYPGAGKTTALREAFAPAMHHSALKYPILHTAHFPRGGAHYPRTSDPIIELGARRPNGFGGTDALSMNAVTRVEGWLDAVRHDVTYLVAEGDRLANDRFFNFCSDLGELTVALIDVGEAVATARCAKRGSKQDASWRKGRMTKVDRLAEKWVDPDWRLDGMLKADTLGERIRRHPVFAPLHQEVR